MITKELKIAKEQKELSKWRQMKAKPIPKHYMTIMVAVISIVYLLDALATDIHGGLSELEITFFSNQLGKSYEQVLALFSIISATAIIMNMLAPFYKALADKIGRKALFMISTAGMGLGLLLGYFSTNLVVYVIGRVILTFFVIADIQEIYIVETAPAKHRAKLFSLTKCLSFLGLLIIPLCRDLLLDPSGSNWREVCIVPTFIAIGCVFLISLFLRESDVFLDKKIAYLETPYDERQAEITRKKEAKEVDVNKGGLGTAFKYIFRDKQLRNIVLSSAVFLLGMNSFISYFNTICLKQGMTTGDITSALYLYPLTAALATLVAGFLSDKLGRKVNSAIYCAIAFTSMLIYTLFAGTISPLIIGALYGLCYGGYWTVGDSINMMLSESSRTEIRSSVIAAAGIVALGASLISVVIYGILVLSVNITVLCIVGAVITMALMLVLLFLGTKETKGIALQ